MINKTWNNAWKSSCFPLTQQPRFFFCWPFFTFFSHNQFFSWQYFHFHVKFISKLKTYILKKFCQHNNPEFFGGGVSDQKPGFLYIVKGYQKGWNTIWTQKYFRNSKVGQNFEINQKFYSFKPWQNYKKISVSRPPLWLRSGLNTEVISFSSSNTWEILKTGPKTSGGNNEVVLTLRWLLSKLLQYVKHNKFLEIML